MKSNNRGLVKYTRFGVFGLLLLFIVFGLYSLKRHSQITDLYTISKDAYASTTVSEDIFYKTINSKDVVSAQISSACAFIETSNGSWYDIKDIILQDVESALDKVQVYYSIVPEHECTIYCIFKDQDLLLNSFGMAIIAVVLITSVAFIMAVESNEEERKIYE